jgi:hypothetical protein
MRHEPYNVFVLLEPPNMTNILQPLDVDVNRSYREYYRGNYHEYIVKAMKEPLLQTKARNPKYLATIWYKWTLDWVASKEAAKIMRAFTLCGLVSKEEFEVAALHPPLRELLAGDVDMEIGDQ